MIGFKEVEPRLKIALRKYNVFDPRLYHALQKSAEKSRGRSVIHINATKDGGGVAELLHTQIPFERALGLRSRWVALAAPKRFFEVTKKLHNLLQGRKGSLTRKERNVYLKTNAHIGKKIERFLCKIGDKNIVVVIHDPQPLPLISFIPKHIPVIVRLHIDLSTPNRSALALVKPFFLRARTVVISNRSYRPALSRAGIKKTSIVMPAIDPLSEKNAPLPAVKAKKIVGRYGIDCSKPILTQVSRFDSWKDPLGVLHAYHLARHFIPDLQLVLVGFFLAKDDPEAISVFETVKQAEKNDPGIYLFSDLRAIKGTSNDTFINALHTASTVIIQKSIREGFGLTITEAMWKGKAVVAGRTSGTRIQIKNNHNGILISSAEEAAQAIVRLLEAPSLRARLGRAARHTVQKKFLMPRFVFDNIAIYNTLAASRVSRKELS